MLEQKRALDVQAASKNKDALELENSVSSTAFVRSFGTDGCEVDPCDPCRGSCRVGSRRT